MAHDKPDRVVRFGGTSAAPTGGEYTEPPGGKKDIGWELDDEPPASYWNWLNYQTYKWFRWFNERMFDVPTAADFTVKPRPPAATSDDGGDLHVEGGTSGTDANKLGGDATLSGGQGRGTGSSKAILQASTRDVAGVGTNVPEDYIVADGGGLAGPTTRGRVDVSKSLIVQTPAASDGDALVGSASSGTGHGVVATADTTSPVKSALAVTPQDTDPSAPANGQIYANAVNDQIAHYSALLSRFQNLDPIIEQTIVDATQLSNTLESSFNQTATIPADTLRVGSVITVTSWGKLTAAAPTQLNLRIRIGGVAMTGQLGIPGVPTGSAWHHQTIVIVRAIGGAVTWNASGRMFANAALSNLDGAAGPVNTGAPMTVEMRAGTNPAAAGSLIDMFGFIVKVQ